MIETMLPVTIKMAAAATYRFVPSSLSMNDLSFKVQTPIEKTMTPPTCKQARVSGEIFNELISINYQFNTLNGGRARLIQRTYKYDGVRCEQRILYAFTQTLDHDYKSSRRDYERLKR